MRLLVCIIAFLPSGIFGQRGATSSGFEVVSVKPNTSMQDVAGNRFGPKRMTWTNVSLKTLIEAAYELKDYQVAGGPRWLESARWDIEATTGITTNSDQKYRMLQTLLADRFHLRVHWESKEVQIYRLVVGKKGSKLKESSPNEPTSGGTGTVVNRGMISGHQTAVSTLVYFLSTQLDRPIVDNTGLSANYEFTLKWDPDDSQRPGEDGSVPTDSHSASVFAAVPEQLGLKLEAAKGPSKVLVIDGVDRPSEN
jgi:uncharacterized protein (TIGR03435 family)